MAFNVFRNFSNVFDAISSGAMDMIRPIASIIANVIALVALFSFLDAVCIWFFSMIHLHNFGLAVFIY
jgi:nucleoside permease NupC